MQISTRYLQFGQSAGFGKILGHRGAGNCQLSRVLLPCVDLQVFHKISQKVTTKATHAGKFSLSFQTSFSQHLYHKVDLRLFFVWQIPSILLDREHRIDFENLCGRRVCLFLTPC